MTVRRGFRAEAERTAVDIRSRLGLRPFDAVDLDDAAGLFAVEIVAADRLVQLERLQELERLQALSFSACTFDVSGKHVVVYNPIRSKGRTRSDVAHEISHLILGHELTEVRIVGGVPFRTCRTDQEEEATTLGGTILLPRALLIRAVARGTTPDGIARVYGVTKEMARFRVHTTGVQRQLQRSSARATR